MGFRPIHRISDLDLFLLPVGDDFYSETLNPKTPLQIISSNICLLTSIFLPLDYKNYVRKHPVETWKS